MSFIGVFLMPGKNIRKNGKNFMSQGFITTCFISVINRNVFKMTKKIESFRSECLKI